MDKIFRGKKRRPNDQARIVGYLQTNGFSVAADQLIDLDIFHLSKAILIHLSTTILKI